MVVPKSGEKWIDSSVTLLKLKHSPEPDTGFTSKVLISFGFIRARDLTRTVHYRSLARFRSKLAPGIGGRNLPEWGI